MGDKIKNSINPIHLLLFKQHYPEQAALLEQALEKGDTEQANQLLQPLYQKLTGFGNIPSDEILKLTANQTVLPDATRVAGTITPAMQQEYNIGQQGGVAGLLGSSTDPNEEARKKIEEELDKKAQELYNQKDFFDRLSLAGKTIQNTVNDVAVGLLETAGILVGGAANIFGQEDAARSIFEGISKAGEITRTFFKLQHGISPEDELVMNRTTEYQVLNGLTFAGMFLLGGTLTSGLPKLASYGVRSLIATQEGARESLQAYEQTKNINTAIDTYIANLPADMSEFAIDRLVPPMQATLKSITPLYRKALDMVIGGAEGFITEGGQELFQQWWHNLTAREIYDNNRRLTDNLEQSFEVGGLVGLLLGGAFRLTQMKLSDPNLTPQERNLLERSRNEMTGLLSRFDLSEHINNSVKSETPVFRHDPSSIPLISQKIEELQNQIPRAMQTTRGTIIEFDEFEFAKNRALEQMKNAPTTLQKAGALVDYTLALSKGTLQSLSDFSTHITTTFGKQFAPFTTTLYGLARSPLGLAFLSYLSSNPDLLNDPSVTSALMMPLAFVEHIGLAKNLIIGQLELSTGRELAVISPEGYDISKDFWSDFHTALSAAENGQLPAIENQLSKYLSIPTATQNRVKKLLDVKVKFVGDINNHPDFIASYNPITKTIQVNAGLLAIHKNNRSALLRELELYPLYDLRTTQRFTNEQLLDALIGNAILHETQHHFDHEFKIGAGGSSETFLRISNDIVNDFVGKLYEIGFGDKIQQTINAIKNRDQSDIEALLSDYLPNIQRLKQITPDKIKNASDEEYYKIIETIIDVVSLFPPSPDLNNALETLARNYQDRKLVNNIIGNTIAPLLAENTDKLLTLAALTKTLNTIQNLADKRPTAWGKATIAALDYANYLAGKINLPPIYQGLDEKFYLNIGGEKRARIVERLNTAKKLGIPQPDIAESYKDVIELSEADILTGDSQRGLTETMQTFYSELAETLNQAVRDYGDEYKPVIDFIGQDIQDDGYSVGYDQDGNFIIMFKTTSPEAVNDSVAEYYKLRNAADISLQLEKLFRYNGKPISFSAIWEVAKDGKYNDINLKTRENIDEVLQQVEDDIRKSEKSKPDIDITSLTRYADLTNKVYKQNYPETVVLDPVFAQTYNTKYTGATPRVFFYPLNTPVFYSDILEGQILNEGKQPYNIILPTKDIYFLSKIGNYEVNPLGLDGDPDVIYKIIRKKGYKAVIYQDSVGNYNLATFAPLKAYKSPILKDNATTKLAYQFAEAINYNGYDKDSADKIKAITERAVIKELEGSFPQIATDIKTTPTVALSGVSGVEPVTAVELTADLNKFTDIVNAMAQAGQKLDQASVHIIREGTKPAGIKYGQVLEDKSQWQPMITVDFKSLKPEDAKKIYQAFNNAGYEGVTIDIENNQAYIYHIGDDPNAIQQFITNAGKLKEELSRTYGTEFNTKLSEVVLWSIGKKGERGNITSYDEITDKVLSQTPPTLTQDIPLPKKAYTPDFETILSGQWEQAIDVAKNRIALWNSDKDALYQDIGDGSAYQYTAAYVISQAMETGSSIQSVINNLLDTVPDLKPLETTLYGKVFEAAAQLNNAGIDVKEAAEIRSAINEAIYQGQPFTTKIKDILITTDTEAFNKAKNRAILIDPNFSYDATQDEDFLRYVKDFIRAEYPTYNLDLALSGKENIGEALQQILKELAPDDIRKQWDSLLMKYRILHADNFFGTVIFKQGDNKITTDLTVPLGNAFKVDTYGDGLKTLQNLMSMPANQLLKELRSSEIVETILWKKFTPQIEPTLLGEIWDTLTQGLTNPNELYDFTSIIGKFLQFGWNVMKAGYITGKAFVNKMVSLFGQGIKIAAEKIYKPLREALFSQKPEAKPSETDPERIRRLTGVEEGATKGFTQENLTEKIQNNYDLIDLEGAVKEAKGGRVSVLQTKQAAIKLISDGEVKLEDLDRYDYGVILPAQYVLAYNVMAQEELGNALEQLRLLKEKHKGEFIPATELAQLVEILAPSLKRWAKVRSMISEAGRVIRMGGTEEFSRYVDVLAAYKEMMPPELQAMLDKLKELPEDKRDIDMLGLILYNFVLSNPMTQIANVLGNTVNLAANIMADFAVMPIRTTKSIAHTFARAFEYTKEDIKKIIAGEQEMKNKFVDIKLSTSGYAKLFLPTTMLSLMDAAFRNFATVYKENQLFYKYRPEATLDYYRQVVDVLRADGFSLTMQLDPDTIDRYSALLDTADRFGQYITFQLPPESKAGKIFSEMASHPILRFAVLFAKVPINIFKQGLLYWTPLGAFSIANKLRKGVDTMATKEDLLQQVRTVTAGTALFSSLAYGLISGLLHITGDEPDDEFLRELNRARGFKPYHIYIKQPDGSYKGISYRWAEPMAVVPYLVATIHELYLSPKYRDKIQDADVLQRTSLMLSLVFSYIRDANFMTGINEIFKAGESPKRASEYLERLLVNFFTPNAFSLQTEMPDWMREFTGINFKGKELYVMDNIWDRIKNKVGFGLQEDLVPRTDFFGKPQYNVFERTPFRISHAGDIGEDAEIYEFLSKHSVKIPSLRTDDMLQALRIDKSQMELISTEIGKELKPKIKEIVQKVNKEHGKYYDELTEKARAKYGDEAVAIYKTVGQARLDEVVQNAINQVYNAVKTKTIIKMLPEEARREAMERLYKGEPETIIELEPLKNDDIILQLPE